METYLVGGAVRDELLGRPVGERDWVVVGSTPEELQALGFRQVGRDFPVFLHPQSGEEYALARTERKTGPGHTGFVCHTGPDVTLEDDLGRRDLTVNAMARSADGELLDPFGGQADLEARLLRHVSDAFVEDPLRVFRVARFAAQLPEFTVVPQTRALMQRMARDDLLSELPAERVWQELEKALGCPAPARFFAVLDDAQAMEPWLRELAGVAVTDYLDAARSPDVRFAVLASRLDRDRLQALCGRLKAPRRFQRLAEQTIAHGALLAGWRQADAQAVVRALGDVGALARHRDAEALFAAVEVTFRVGLDELRALALRLRAVDASRVRQPGLDGSALGAAIARARADVVRRAQQARNADESPAL